jgi:hypothetical protein
VSGQPFTAERRERLLVELARGASLTAACATVGTSRTTVREWVARGRAGASAEAVEFTRRLDAVRQGASNGRTTADEQIEDVLERGVKRGSVSAARSLATIRRRRADAEAKAEPDLPPGHPLLWTSLDDPFLALDPCELAYLTPEQRVQARVASAEYRRRRIGDGDPEAPVLLARERLAERIAEHMDPPYQVDWRNPPPWLA